MLRTGYIARVRPWRDYPGDVEIRWYKCPPGARALGVPSLFRSLHWESHPYLFANGLGEVYNSVSKVYPYRAPIGVTGQHHCGTDDDFSKGGTHDEFRPPYPRADDGIAECCRPPLGVLILEGQGASAPGRLGLDSETDFQTTFFLTPPEGIPSVAGLRGVTVVLSSFGVTNFGAINWQVTAGDHITVPLAADAEVGTWHLYWYSGNLLVGFMATGPVHYSDVFAGVVPAGANRLVVQLEDTSGFVNRVWQAAPHSVPPSP